MAKRVMKKGRTKKKRATKKRATVFGSGMTAKKKSSKKKVKRSKKKGGGLVESRFVYASDVAYLHDAAVPSKKPHKAKKATAKKIRSGVKISKRRKSDLDKIFKGFGKPQRGGKR